MKKLILLIILISTSVSAEVPTASKHAMVVTEQYLASQIGKDILKKGGNAIDAAVAVGYALAVVLPHSGNLGGGGFMTIHFANGKNIFINFRERAPFKATENMYLDPAGNLHPSNSTQGYLAVAVPGTVLGFDVALKKYGKLTRQEVMAPAIKLAAEGYQLTSGDMQIYNSNIKNLKKYPNVEAIFLKNKKTFHVGDTLIQKNLAHTLQLISDNGAKEFYQGSIAKKIVEASQQHGGILTYEDFAKYNVEELKPIICTYHDKEIITAPPPSSGGVTLCEALNILEGYPLAQYGFMSIPSLRYTIEALRFSFEDRNIHLGDPNFINNPLAKLLSKEYAASIRYKISKAKVTSHTNIPLKMLSEGNNTTHYSIIDQWGNAVGVTYTLNSFYGAQVMAGDTGFFLNNEMDDFAAKPGSANQFGLIQGAANSIAPGKRPLSSMTPTIVLQNKKVLMVTGSPGGPRIISSVLESMLDVFDYHMNIQDAVDAKRFHQQWMPDIVYLEPGTLSSTTLNSLKQDGYIFKTDQPWGAVEAIYVDPKTNIIYGGSDDRRKSGRAIGY